MNSWKHMESAIKDRVLVLDGGMGTALQAFRLEEADYRGKEFADWDMLLGGNNDLLNITRPDVVRAVHEGFLEAGADLIETNTFNATSISQSDYGLQGYAPEIAEAGARLARELTEEWSTKTPEKPRAVLGAIGPLSKTLSLSPKVEDPGYREVDFDQVAQSYREQILAMFNHVDALLIETVFDTLNCKAAIYAAMDVFADKGKDLPLLISGTITDKSGRTLSGQTTEAFWTSVRHAKPFAVGLNCALGADELRPYVMVLSKVADTYVLAYPNAGLPNMFGEYDQTPEEMSAHISEWAREGLVNIVGGCCGSSKDHITAIAIGVSGCAPRRFQAMPKGLRLSGLESFALVTDPNSEMQLAE